MNNDKNRNARIWEARALSVKRLWKVKVFRFVIILPHRERLQQELKREIFDQ